MPCFDTEDRPSDGQVRFVRDGTGGADVGRDTNTLEYGREGDEGLGIGVGEGVGSLFDSLCTEGGGEE